MRSGGTGAMPTIPPRAPPSVYSESAGTIRCTPARCGCCASTDAGNVIVVSCGLADRLQRARRDQRQEHVADVRLFPGLRHPLLADHRVVAANRHVVGRRAAVDVDEERSCGCRFETEVTHRIRRRPQRRLEAVDGDDDVRQRRVDAAVAQLRREHAADDRRSRQRRQRQRVEIDDLRSTGLAILIAIELDAEHVAQPVGIEVHADAGSRRQRLQIEQRDRLAIRRDVNARRTAGDRRTRRTDSAS